MLLRSSHQPRPSHGDESTATLKRGDLQVAANICKGHDHRLFCPPIRPMRDREDPASVRRDCRRNTTVLSHGGRHVSEDFILIAAGNARDRELDPPFVRFHLVLHIASGRISGCEQLARVRDLLEEACHLRAAFGRFCHGLEHSISRRGPYPLKWIFQMTGFSPHEHLSASLASLPCLYYLHPLMSPEAVRLDHHIRPYPLENSGSRSLSHR
ncbi:hypothetical protein GQ607_016633 [Colletotrichum asianum]|uniref:Uncharacterized protein n=1 Tax=Colletotrichum asianum TaxID=702518 RepID=A0A8H3VXH6_9PEZI|nr:hypothetical protein GQ607_016633 [Colletotrichum asianum]